MYAFLTKITNLKQNVDLVRPDYQVSVLYRYHILESKNRI